MQTGSAAADDTVEMVPVPPDRRVPAQPVFVDATGRRQRRVRRIGRILVVPAIGYVGLLVSTLLGGPTINSPYLPLPAAPGSAQSQGSGSHTGPHAGSHPGTPASGRGGSGAGTGTGTPAASSSAAPTASATQPAPGVTHGHSTHTAAPPGASHHPTKKAKAHP